MKPGPEPLDPGLRRLFDLAAPGIVPSPRAKQRVGNRLARSLLSLPLGPASRSRMPAELSLRTAGGFSFWARLRTGMLGRVGLAFVAGGTVVGSVLAAIQKPSANHTPPMLVSRTESPPNANATPHANARRPSKIESLPYPAAGTDTAPPGYTERETEPGSCNGSDGCAHPPPLDEVQRAQSGPIQAPGENVDVHRERVEVRRSLQAGTRPTQITRGAPPNPRGPEDPPGNGTAESHEGLSNDRVDTMPGGRSTAGFPHPSSLGTPARSTWLAMERASIDGARRALARGQTGQALHDLAEHERLFPTGMFAQEREALAVNALVQSGRYEEARARADRFALRFPNSILQGSVRAAIAAIPR